jgi:SAM-dependent methyltransferase
LKDALFLNELKEHGRLVDIGSGSGNYTIAIANKTKDINIVGIEPSSVMIDQASDNFKKQGLYNNVKFVQAFANKIPFRDNYFDGLTCILATHHFNDLQSSIKDMMRVVKSNSRVVILTADPRLKDALWIDRYFGFLVESARDAYVPISDLLGILNPYALKPISVEPLLLSKDIEDLFFLSGWARPELYLNEDVRKGISHFAKSMQSEEGRNMIDRAINKLESDINSNYWSKKYKSQVESISGYDGGYRIVSFTKR